MADPTHAGPRVLWITRTYPFPPAFGGDLLYSRNMLRATALSGVNITAMVLHGEALQYQFEQIPNLRWVEAGRTKRPNWHTLFSPLPNCAGRYHQSGIFAKLMQTLDSEPFDAIVFDSHATAGYLDEIKHWRSQSGRKVRLIYIAHNHEATTQQIVANATRSQPMRFVMQRDAVKTAKLEGKLVRSCDGMTAITEEDRLRFEAEYGPLNCAVATPAYNERRVAARDIAQTGRVVSILGNFLWVAKRINLELFLTEAAKLFPNRSIKLRVAGNMNPAHRDEVRARFPWATVLGRVDSMEPELDAARIGVVPDCVGGGFKLRTLGYAFNRIPIAGVVGGMVGTQLRPNIDFIAADDIPSLVATIAEVIDNVPMLSALADQTYTICEQKFGDWQMRGDAVRALIEGGRVAAH